MRYFFHLLGIMFLCILSAPLVPLSVSQSDTPDEVEFSPFRERSQPLDHITASQKEERCLTQAIYYESGNQSVKGKEAVAWVVINRVGKHGYANTICAVVSQARMIEERKICQFSFWCERQYKPNQVLWEESNGVAKRVLQNMGDYAILNQYGEATHYHARYVHPSWAKRLEKLGQIEDHIFYKDRL